MNQTAAIIQARSASTRFPGKVLATLGGLPMLEHIILMCKTFVRPIVAIPVGDAALKAWLEKKGYEFFEGSPDNLLYRYYKCAKHFSLDTILRITGDCPFIQQADLCMMAMVGQQCDFASNCVHYCEDGFEIESMSFKALEWAFNQTKDPYDLEHVTPYFKRDLQRFTRAGFRYLKFYPKYNPAWFPKLSVDTPEELALVEKQLQEINAYGKDEDRWKGSLQKLLQLA